MGAREIAFDHHTVGHPAMAPLDPRTGTGSQISGCDDCLELPLAHDDDGTREHTRETKWVGTAASRAHP